MTAHTYRARHGADADDWLIVVFPEVREDVPHSVELPDGPYDLDSPAEQLRAAREEVDSLWNNLYARENELSAALSIIEMAKEWRVGQGTWQEGMTELGKILNQGLSA